MNVFRGFGLNDEQAAPVVSAICSDPDRWVDFMMRYEMGLEEPDPGRAVGSALTIGFRAVKGRLTGIKPPVGGLQTAGIGGFAAVAAFGIARWIS